MVDDPDKPAPPIVFFDGECVLCHRFATWLLERDRDRIFRLTTLQGETARKTLGPQKPDPEQWAVVLKDAEGTHERSEAVLRIAARLGGAWGVAAKAASWIPAALRDPIYKLIARNRYRWFGKEQACRLPRTRDDTVLLP